MSKRTGKECGCYDWKQNIDKVNGPITLQAIRMGDGGYDGKIFVYCPWCGKKIEEIEDEEDV